MSSDPALYAQRTAQLIDRLSRLMRELQFAGGLNPAQWEALRFIRRANRYSRTPGALAEFLGTTKGTVSQTLISLENKGLVARMRSTADRRVTQIELTAAGETMLRQDPILALEAAAENIAAELGGAMVRGLSRLLHDLQQQHGIREFGVCADCSLFCVSSSSRRPAGSGAHCGLTGEDISPDEQSRICIDFRPH